ncbi:organelle RRM domain-containing protein 1, chloroplastic-like [Primulina tabacum]|uniref:organelle RRM domain-containing protein 1, chloroplastic-like n=1 Tax=Primulina tabacum TaxID=48773 RepID=UPI003F5A82C3
MRVLGNGKDAQMCMYHVSWESNYGFCGELDNECAQELAGIPGVLSVQPDENFGSDDKDYNGESGAMEDSSGSLLTTNIKTKKAICNWYIYTPIFSTFFTVASPFLLCSFNLFLHCVFLVWFSGNDFDKS